MKIIVFGATGNTGKEILSQAVAQGHSVTAFVRNPQSLAQNSNIKVVQGDIFNPAVVADAVWGYSAVFSALGPRSREKTGLLARSVPNILAGMLHNHVPRLIVLGAAGTQRGFGKYQNALTRSAFWLAKRTLLRHPFADQVEQERLLRSSEIDYTIVRPPRLTNGPFTGKYRVLPDALPSGATHVSRADVAHFMLLQLTDPRFHRQGPYIGD